MSDDGIMVVKMKEGEGAINAFDIGGVIPDIDDPASHSVIYTGSFPNGISVEGNSAHIIGLWMLAVEPDEPALDEEPVDE